MAIPSNPTWPEAQAGMVKARDAYRAAQNKRQAAEQAIRAQRDIIKAQEELMRVAMAELNAWESAVRRKLLAGL